MNIDMKEVRDDVIGHLSNGVAYVNGLSNHDQLLIVGGLVFGYGLFLAIREGVKVYLKHRELQELVALEQRIAMLRMQRKGEAVKMILQERRDKIDRILSDGLTDLLLDAEMAGKLSRKEADEEYQRLSTALHLPDLIPRQRRFSILKDQIKGRFNRGVYGKKPHIVTGKPKPFRERIGTFANQFWRSKGA